MAKSPVPWSIKGIDPDTRAVAKERAKEAGMTLGEWLSQAIKEGGFGEAEMDAQSSDEQSSAQASDQPRPTSLPRPVTGITVQHLKELVDSVNRLNDRLRVTERNSRETANGLNLGLTSVMERIKRIESTKAGGSKSGSRDNIDTLKSLEGALRQVVDQFESTSAETLERVSTNEQAVSVLAERMEKMDGQTSEAFAQMRRAIDHITKQIQQTEKTAKAVMLQARAATKSSDAEFVEQTGKRLRILGGEIKRSGDQIQALERLIQKLSEKIEASEHRSSEGIMRVTTTLEDLRVELGKFDAGDDEGAQLEAQTAIANAGEQAGNRMESLQKNFHSMIARLEGVIDVGQKNTDKQETEDEGTTEDNAQKTQPLSAKPAAEISSDLTIEGAPGTATPLKAAMSASDDHLDIGDEDEFETIFGDPIDQDQSEEAEENPDSPESLLEALVPEDADGAKPKRPLRRELTAKQKQILAARARRKRLQEQQSGIADTAPDEADADHGPVITAKKPEPSDDDNDKSGDKSSANSDAKNENAENASRLSRFEEMRRRYGDRDGMPVPMMALIGVAITAILLFAWFQLKDSFGGPKTPPVQVEQPSPQTGAITGEPTSPTNPATGAPGTSQLPPTGEDLVFAKNSFLQGYALLQEAGDIERGALGAGRALTEEESQSIAAKVSNAFPLIRRAALRGYPIAEYQMGEMTLGGIGTEPSQPGARRWFQTAAEHGNVDAMHKLGAMSANGWGGEKNMQAAIYWFEQAAQHGVPDSMFNLGLLYMPQLLLAEGQTIDPAAIIDPAKSYFWLSLAGRRGDQEATNMADEVATMLTPETRTRIDQQIALWTPKQPDPAAN
jgi:localization factor PodJL